MTTRFKFPVAGFVSRPSARTVTESVKRNTNEEEDLNGKGPLTVDG